MVQQTLIKELQGTFERVAEVIRTNDPETRTGERRFNFKSASLLISDELSAEFVAKLTAPGLLVFLRLDREPFLGVMGRVDFRRGGAAELRGTAHQVAKEHSADPI